MNTETFKKIIRQSLCDLISEAGGGISRNMSLTSIHSAKYRNNKNYPFHKHIHPKKKEEIYIPDDDAVSEISSEEIQIPKEYIHDRLNPQLWNVDELRTEIRTQLLKIASEFENFLDINTPWQTVKLLGSMANYNWSHHSDIDLHLFFDFKEINPDAGLVKKYLDAKKSIWNSKHNINIKGFNVEVYAQDVNEINISSGIYNLVSGKWEKKPSADHFDVDKIALATKLTSIINQIEDLNNMAEERKYEAGEKIKNTIKRMRQCGLEEAGEFAIENLAFKFLRNNGYIEKLFEIIRNAYDSRLSIK